MLVLFKHCARSTPNRGMGNYTGRPVSFWAGPSDEVGLKALFPVRDWYVLDCYACGTFVTQPIQVGPYMRTEHNCPWHACLLPCRSGQSL